MPWWSRPARFLVVTVACGWGAVAQPPPAGPHPDSTRADPVQSPLARDTSEALRRGPVQDEAGLSVGLRPRAPAWAPLPDSARLGALDPVLLERPGPTLSPVRVGLAAGALVGGSAALYAWEKGRWWTGDLAPFHFDDHLDYAANMDKAAHFVATEIQALAATEIIEWAGVERGPASVGGALTAWLLQLQVEYHDGFYPQWGFDRFDVAANTLGAAWFVARERAPALGRFYVRWGYVPVDPNPALWFNEDYERHSYWLSMRTRDLLPEPVRGLWPAPLALSLGVAVADWDPARPYETGTAELYLSLDVDYDALGVLDTPVGRSVASVLNRFHLPAPAVRLAPEPRLFLVFYGQ